MGIPDLSVYELIKNNFAPVSLPSSFQTFFNMSFRMKLLFY